MVSSLFWNVLVNYSSNRLWYFSLKHTETRVFCFWWIRWVSNTQFLLKWCRPNICNLYHKNNSLQYVHREATRFVGNSKQVLFVFHHSELHFVEVLNRSVVKEFKTFTKVKDQKWGNITSHSCSAYDYNLKRCQGYRAVSLTKWNTYLQNSLLILPIIPANKVKRYNFKD